MAALFWACVVARADGPVYAIVGGPPLSRVGSRNFISGMLPHTPRNLVRWLRFPQGVLAGDAMPDMGIDEAQARDIGAYLYTLR